MIAKIVKSKDKELLFSIILVMKKLNKLCSTSGLLPENPHTN